jgi:LPXTG-motif cell wall-anchored protein
MNKFSLKALGATLLTIGLVVAGVAFPAHAAGGVTVTANGTLPVFTGGQPSPAFAVNVDPNGTQLYNTVTISVASSSDNWTPTTCSGTLPACGVSVSNVTLDNDTPATVSAGPGGVNLIGIQNTTATFVVNFDAGVWSSVKASGNYNFSVQNGTPLVISVAAPPNCNSGTGGYLTIIRGNTGLTPNGLAFCTYRSASASTVAPANVFVKSGFSFTGWNTQSDGLGTTYAPGAAVNATDMNTFPTLTLHAQWVEGDIPATTSVDLTLSAAVGDLVAGSSVAVVASGLQSTASYEVVVRSTPQTIGTGNAISGAVNTSVNLPSELEAGWHSLTFTSTAADGSAVESKSYFKVSASGTLLATSTTIPAELANTGTNSDNEIMFLLGGLSLAFIGVGVMLVARRKSA